MKRNTFHRIVQEHEDKIKIFELTGGEHMKVANISNPFMLCFILIAGIFYVLYIVIKTIYTLINGLIQNAK